MAIAVNECNVPPICDPRCTPDTNIRAQYGLYKVQTGARQSVADHIGEAWEYCFC